ncbi:unnamed protein product [Brassica oleracea var. botrytis]
MAIDRVNIGERRLVASENLRKGEKLLFVPPSLGISADSVRTNGEAGEVMKRYDVSDWALQLFKEHNYLGPSGLAEDDKAAISLKATELTLGLLVSRSPVYTEKIWMAQIVGWPQVRSFRKNTMATTCSAALFVKVSMDGAPYLRKVDLRSYTNYMELSSALEKMFTTFTLGQCGSNRATWKDKLSETKLKDILNGKDYVLMKTRMEIGCVLEMFHWTKFYFLFLKTS